MPRSMSPFARASCARAIAVCAPNLVMSLPLPRHPVDLAVGLARVLEGVGVDLIRRDHLAHQDLAEHEIAVHGLCDDGCNLLVRKLDERVVLGGARLRSVSDGGGGGREARVSTWPQAAEPGRTRRRRRTLRLRARWIRLTRPNCEKNPFICSS